MCFVEVKIPKRIFSTCRSLFSHKWRQCSTYLATTVAFEITNIRESMDQWKSLTDKKMLVQHMLLCFVKLLWPRFFWYFLLSFHISITLCENCLRSLLPKFPAANRAVYLRLALGTRSSDKKILSFSFFVDKYDIIESTLTAFIFRLKASTMTRIIIYFCWAPELGAWVWIWWSLTHA